jgi:hypothetical protein
VAQKRLSTLAYFSSAHRIGPVAFGDQGKNELIPICSALNSHEKPEVREELRRIVHLWQVSGPNLEKMMYGGDTDLFNDVSSACKVIWTPTESGRAQLVLVPHYDSSELELLDGEREPRPRAEAAVLFHFLTLNPQCDKLAGPCARCGNYYIKKRASQKVYCSRRCGNAATAVIYTRERLAKERQDKLRRANEAARRWSKARTHLDWKVWVSRKESDITPKFLTRAVGLGHLKPPVVR